MAVYRLDLAKIEQLIERLLERSTDFQVLRSAPGRELVFDSPDERDGVLITLAELCRYGLDLALSEPPKNPAITRFGAGPVPRFPAGSLPGAHANPDRTAKVVAAERLSASGHKAR